MSELNDKVFDDGLNVLTDDTETLHLLSQDPGLTFSNIATYGLGSKSGPTVAAPSDRTAGGREVIVAAITDGSATATGDATHYALTDDSLSLTLAVGELSGTLPLTSGGVFGLATFNVGHPDPTT